MLARGPPSDKIAVTDWLAPPSVSRERDDRIDPSSHPRAHRVGHVALIVQEDHEWLLKPAWMTLP